LAEWYASLYISTCRHACICSLLSLPTTDATSVCPDEGRYYYYDDVVGLCQECANICINSEKWGTTPDCRTHCPDWPHSTSTSPRMITASAPHSTETLDNGLISPVNAEGPSYGVTIGVIIGVTIGVVFVVVPIIIAVIVLVRYKRNKSAKKKRENHTDSPHLTKRQSQESVPTEQATGIPESSLIKEAEGNFRRESFVFATDLNTSTVSINVWPGAEDFFRNFHVREEYDFRGIPAGENASRVSEFNRNIEVKVLAEPQNISSDEPSETDPCL
ncbi:hypothetical protein CAPTEDRAFT_195922, partial [Capitella teleta]